MGLSVHKPPVRISPIGDKEPVIFLAGPIQGAIDWQHQAIINLSTIQQRQRSPAELHIASPRREYVDNKFNYHHQVKWEKQHLHRAALLGAIIFWFAAQNPDIPYEEGRAYAQTSRIEFGRVMGWKDYLPDINLVLGIEPGYVGSERYFRTCAKEIDIEVHETLISTCEEAMLKITSEEQ